MSTAITMNGDEFSPSSLFENLVWLNSKDAANYLRKTAGALRTAVCRGQIRAYKWRRRLYFKKSELDRLLAGAFLKGGL